MQDLNEENYSFTRVSTNSQTPPSSPLSSTTKSSSQKFFGRWTQEEHRKFVEALKKYGKNWKKVEEHIETRDGAQIRSHAQKFFNRLQKQIVSKDKEEISSSNTDDSIIEIYLSKRKRANSEMTPS